MFDVEKLVKSPKFRHACEGRGGYPVFKVIFYNFINAGLSMYDVHLLKNHPKGYRNTETLMTELSGESSG
jgi:hypothetical protein